MPKRTSRQGRSYWAQLVAEYEERAGQETHEAFAQRKRINVWTFRNWLYKVRSARGERAVRFVEVKTTDVAIGGRDIEIELGGGRCTVRFDSRVEVARIGELVAVLAARLDC